MDPSVSRRVGVLTFHRCINYGSYWQARCLVEALRARGLDARVLDHRSASVDRQEWRNALHPTRPDPPRREDRPAYARKARRLLEAVAALPLSDPFPLDRPEEAGAWDAVIVGSDEVWNFRHPWYAGRPIFFGEGLRTPRLMAYAASFGAHDAADGVHPEQTARLSRFHKLSVRDENSRRLLAQAIDGAPEITVDPCLLNPGLPRRAGESGELVVYGHGFSPAFSASVRAWADRRGARIVSLGYRNDWADVQHIDADPETFATQIGAARAVATNFFHGCVFALLNRKPFAAELTDYRAHKIGDLLQRADASDLLMSADSPDADFAHALDTPPFVATGDRLAGQRATSQRFLDEALAW